MLLNFFFRFSIYFLMARSKFYQFLFDFDWCVFFWNFLNWWLSIFNTGQHLVNRADLTNFEFFVFFEFFGCWEDFLQKVYKKYRISYPNGKSRTENFGNTTLCWFFLNSALCTSNLEILSCFLKSTRRLH